MSELAKGLVYQSLERTSKEIRQDRGQAIAEDLEITFKRQCEDLARDIKQKERARINLYDFSPTNSQSLILIKDLSSHEICKKDQDLTLELRDLSIKLELALQRYKDLFGKEVIL
jgi:hypothetical protein